MNNNNFPVSPSLPLSLPLSRCADVNECESNPSSNLGPCINAAFCENTPGAFTCTCLDGWSGSTCARDVDDCIGQCKNGATCIDLVNDYHCACASGFTGSYEFDGSQTGLRSPLIDAI